MSAHFMASSSPTACMICWEPSAGKINIEKKVCVCIHYTFEQKCITYGNIWSLPLPLLPRGHPYLFISSKTVLVRALYQATCFVTFDIQHTIPKGRKNTQHMISKSLLEDPLVCHNAALKKTAIRVVCSNGWRMWKLASLRSLFNLTPFQSTFSNRWASLRDYTWPPGSTPASATESLAFK